MEDILASIICLGVWTWFKVKVGLQFKFLFGSGAGEGTSMEVFTQASTTHFTSFSLMGREIRAAIPSNKWVSLHNY